jgi:hypothetical protein
MGVAWSSKPLSQRTVGAPGSSWDIHSQAKLEEMCTGFENLIQGDSAHGAFYAINALCGHYVAWCLVQNESLREPLSYHYSRIPDQELQKAQTLQDDITEDNRDNRQRVRNARRLQSACWIDIDSD